MKLRLENGNFTIKVTFIKNDDGQAHAPVYDSLPTGLKPIDFVGAVVEQYYDGTLEMLSNVTNTWYANESHDLVAMRDTLMVGNAALGYYNPLNGKVGGSAETVLYDDSTDEGGSDGGGDGR
jgi:hypothetical protein